MVDGPTLPDAALSEVFLAGTGPGGQNVNKVATSVRLRLDVFALRLPLRVFEQLRDMAGSRWTNEGEIVVVARTHRTREANRTEARERLSELVARAHHFPDRRIKTRPTRSAKEKRMGTKAVRGAVKRGRGRVAVD